MEGRGRSEASRREKWRARGSPLNLVFVGKKPPMSYALAMIIQFNQGAKEVTVKARGMAISKAVDAVEIVRRRFMEKMVIKDIRIGTETVGEGGNKRSVSTIEIKLAM